MAKNRRSAPTFFAQTAEDLPIFSGTCPRAKEPVFEPQLVQTARLPGFDMRPDWQELAERRDRIIKPRRRRNKT